MKSQEDTVAVMVLYQPPKTVMEAVEKLLPQVKALVIVDNGDNEEMRASLFCHPELVSGSISQQAQGDGWMLKQVQHDKIRNIHFLKSPQNNLAMAQNLGIAKARELGAEFVLLMDDDSIPVTDMVQQLREAWQPDMGVVGPYLEEPELGRASKYIQASGKYGFRRVGFAASSTPESPRDSKAIQIDSPRIAESNSGNDKILSNLFYVAASGSLIPLSIIDSVGGMDEDLGLYFVDTEFCLRVRQAGYDIVVVRAAILRHRFGNRSEHKILGMTISTTNHPPRARYWMARNRSIVMRQYWQKQPGYVIFDILRIESEITRIALFEKNKWAKLKAMWQGVSGQEWRITPL